MEYPHLLSVFSFNGQTQTNEIDIAILNALLKAKKSNFIAQLKLALTWNRIDIAKEFIFTTDKTWEVGSLNEVMYLAIRNQKVDFVKIFCENGSDIKQFLTYRRLLKLYNDVIFEIWI